MTMASHVPTSPALPDGSSVDRWLNQDSQDALTDHPIFGSAPVNGPLFADVTNITHNAFNRKAKEQRAMTAHDEPDVGRLLPEDDDGDDIVNAQFEERQSPHSQAVVPKDEVREWAWSQPQLQQTAGSQRDYFSAFSQISQASGSQPAQEPQSTPQMQRTAAVPQLASPTQLVDGVVRAGLETPMRAPPPPYQQALSSPGTTYTHAPATLSMQTTGGSSNSNSGAASPTSPSNAMASFHAHAMGRDPGAMVLLEFKMDRVQRFRSNGVTVTKDQWVVVRLDNGGIDMGVCVGVYASHERHLIPKNYSCTEWSGVVLRLADTEDCQRLNDVIPDRERDVLAKAHQLVHFLHMPFTCIDVEFQFDLKSVILFYTLTPQAYTSIMPNVPRLQRELGFFAKAKVVLEQLVPVDQA